MSLEEVNALGIVGRYDWQYISIAVELHLVYTNLTIETMHASWQIVAMVNDIIFPILLKNRVMAWTMNRLICIGLKDAAFVFKWSHGSNSRSGILYSIGMIMTGTR